SDLLLRDEPLEPADEVLLVLEEGLRVVPVEGDRDVLDGVEPQLGDPVGRPRRAVLDGDVLPVPAHTGHGPDVRRVVLLPVAQELLPAHPVLAGDHGDDLVHGRHTGVTDWRRATGSAGRFLYRCSRRLRSARSELAGTTASTALASAILKTSMPSAYSACFSAMNACRSSGSSMAWIWL